MSIARLSRDRKRQLGQFFTPAETAAAIVKNLTILPAYRILEPSFGEGAFVFALLDALAPSVPHEDIPAWCKEHLFGCEIDDAAFARFMQRWQTAGLGAVAENMEHCDFFTWMPPGADRAAATDRQRYFASRLESFDLIFGNPPFGGSINPRIQDELDALFGMRNGRKIKKETYAFFIVKSVDLLKPGGRLVFICSDTILTIPTMTGLRSWLQSNCVVDISGVPGSFSDTNQDMILVTLTKQALSPRRVSVLGADLSLAEIDSTPNMSWRVNGDLAKYFTGGAVGDKMIATSGMTIGNNDLFLRPVREGYIEEPYEFTFGEQLITVMNVIALARLGKVAPRRLKKVAQQEARGAVEKVLTWRKLEKPCRIKLPHPDYAFYNKATSRIGYSEPEWVIFWRDQGDYVYTFKKTGNWYLHGVGGMKYFGREGLTWSLIAPRLYARYLPPGYILDSGAPCAFLREGVEQEELYFILGWALTDLCNRILKEVLNHTRNIQSKDFERLPYPVWVDTERKQKAVLAVKALVSLARTGQKLSFKSREIGNLNELYEWQDGLVPTIPIKEPTLRQMSLF
jgi:hypothetical protein